MIELAPIIFIFLICLGAIAVRTKEKKEWNNGYCKECGEKWQLFDVDSQGGRMYKCSNRHRCDISYNVDKIKK